MSDRTFVLTSPHMTGDDVRGCQGDINNRLAVWHVNLKIDVDGDWGMQSRDAAKTVLYGLGVDVGGDFDGVSPSDRIKIRHGWPELTPAEQVRNQDRADWRKRLVARYAENPVDMALDFARAHIGVTEHPAGSNRGPEVDQWERACHILGLAWCGCFVNACLNAAGFPNADFLRFTPAIEAKAKAGIDGWKWITVSNRCQPGDLVLYGTPEAHHVGIVETVANGVDTATIEGNTSLGPGSLSSQSNGGIVARRHRHLDGSLVGFPIRGYARPPYR